jgi:hypothetical protein
MNPIRQGTLAVVLLCAWYAGCPGTSCRAASDLDQPYDVQIVLHLGDHPWLTRVFGDRVAEELRDGMQAALGDMGRVRVISHHPRLAEILARGLDRALDGWADRSDIKTHFVLIDFVGTEYEIQARQYDGLTGRPSPAVRHTRTRDRDFVAKAAALLIEQDFGMLGTIDSAPDGQDFVQVRLKAGTLGSLAGWVHKGQVFEILQPGGTAALDWSLLQVVEPPAEEARDGVCTCKLWHRYVLPGSVQGYRCRMLGTIRAPLRARFVQEQDRGLRRPLDSILGVEVRHFSFQGKTDVLQMSTAPGGWLDTSPKGEKGVFENIAFVSVTNGLAPGDLPKVPVAIIDERPVIIPVRVRTQVGALFSDRRGAWERNVLDSLLVQVSLFKEIHQQGARREGGQSRALERARVGFQRSRDDYQTLTAQRDELAREATKTGIAFDPRREDQRLAELKQGEKELARFVREQEDIDRKESDPQKRQWRSSIEQAKLLEKDFEIGQAIRIYNRVLVEGLDSPEVREYRDKLSKMWEPVDEKHREARNFIYKVWPNQDEAGLKAHMKEAHAAFEECKRVGDIIGPQKLYKLCDEHAKRLEKQLSKLNPKLVYDDEKPARLIEEVSSALQRLATEIHAYLQKKSGVTED